MLLPLLPEENYRARVLLCGGAQPEKIDLNAPIPTWAPTGQRTLLGTPVRRNLNVVLLPTAEVLVCGGVVDGGDDNTAVKEAELYRFDPTTNTDNWSVLPPARVGRNYHSVALLMPDERVWTAGSNINSQQGYNNRRLVFQFPFGSTGRSSRLAHARTGVARLRGQVCAKHESRASGDKGN